MATRGRGTARRPARVLRRAEVELAGNFHQDFRDIDATMQKVEVLCAQPEHLADPQSAERAEHDEAAIALVDGIGERTDLSGSEESSLLTFDSRETYPVARRSGNPPAATAVAMIFRISNPARTTLTVRGRER